MEDKVLFLKALEVLCEKIIELQSDLYINKLMLENAEKKLADIEKNMLVDSGESYGPKNVKPR